MDEEVCDTNMNIRAKPKTLATDDSLCHRPRLQHHTSLLIANWHALRRQGQPSQLCTWRPGCPIMGHKLLGRRRRGVRGCFISTGCLHISLPASTAALANGAAQGQAHHRDQQEERAQTELVLACAASLKQSQKLLGGAGQGAGTAGIDGDRKRASTSWTGPRRQSQE